MISSDDPVNSSAQASIRPGWEASATNRYNYAIVPNSDVSAFNLVEIPELRKPIGTDGNFAGATFNAAADIDGDGAVDLFGPDGTFYGSPTKTKVLTHVEDGLGNFVSIDYDGPLAYDGTCENTATTWPETCLKRTRGLVSDYSTGVDDGNSTTTERRYDYTYKNARMNLTGHGWLGFDQVQVFESFSPGIIVQGTRPPSNRITTTVFEPPARYSVATGQALALDDATPGYVYPLAGLPNTVTVDQHVSDTPGPLEAASHSRRMRVQNGWQVGLSKLGSPFAKLGSRTTTRFDPASMTDEDGPVVSTSGESYAEDEYGNVIDQVTEVAPFERVETTTQYTPNSDAWLISNPEFVTINASSAFGSPQTQTYDPEYDELGRLKSFVRSPSGLITEYRKTEYQRDGFGNPYQIVESVNSGEPPRTTSITYDVDNIYPFIVYDALGNPTQIHFDERWGLPATTSDANGIVERRSYDGLGLLSEQDDSTGKTIFTYSTESGAASVASGLIHPRIKMKADRQGTQGTRTASEVQETDYRSRLVRAQSEGLGGVGVVREQVFDDRGRMIASTLPHQTSSSPVPTTTYEYDDLDRPTLLHNSDGTTVQRQYASIVTLRSDYQHWLYRECFTSEIRFCPDSDVEVSVDESGLRNVLVRDYHGGIIRNFDGDNFDSAALYASYFYDSLRRLETIGENGAPSNGIASIVTSLQHDSYGRLLRHYDPDTAPHPTQDTYNGFDEVTVETDPRLQQRFYTHDLLGRVTGIRDSQGPTTFTYDHDPNSAIFRPNAIGRLTSMTSPPTDANPAGQRVDYFYEPVASLNRGALQRSDYVIDGSTYSVEYSYDDLGRISTIAYPDLGNGPRVIAKYGYDTSGVLVNLSELQGSAMSPLWQLNTPAFEGYLVQDETFGNGARSTYAYDPDRHFLHSITTTQGSAGTTTIQNITYERNPNGQIWYRGPALDIGGPNGVGLEYQYDALGRLSRFQDLSNPSAAVSYNYDSFGNITQNGVHGITYNYASARPHEVLSVDSNVYGYDTRGNVNHREGPDVPDNQQDITYTPFNLPSVVTAGTNAVQFEYSAAEGRLVRRDSEGVRDFVENLYQRLATPDGATTTEERFRMYAGRRLIGEIIRTPGSGDKMQFFHSDDLDTVDTISGTTNADAVHQSFEPFGLPLGPDPAVTRVGFTGQDHDSDLGLIDMHGRIYDPLAGRFMSQDPVMQAPFWSQGPNRYSYAFNDPVDITDPSGFDIETPWNTYTSDVPSWASGGGIASDASDVGADFGSNAAVSASSSAVTGSIIAGGAGSILRLLAGNPFAAQPGYSVSGTGNFHRTGGATRASSPGQGGGGDRFLNLPPSGDPISVFAPPPPDPPLPPLAVRAWAQGPNTVLEYPGGAREIRGGPGSLAWKNNNPGNLRSSPYQIGRAHGFAVFPNEAEGEGALRSLLSSDKYASKTIDQAINSYAPSFENNTAAYQSSVRNGIGVPGSTRIDQLTNHQFDALVNTIRGVEGWQPGSVVFR